MPYYVGMKCGVFFPFKLVCVIASRILFSIILLSTKLVFKLFDVNCDFVAGQAFTVYLNDHKLNFT